MLRLSRQYQYPDRPPFKVADAVAYHVEEEARSEDQIHHMNQRIDALTEIVGKLMEILSDNHTVSEDAVVWILGDHVWNIHEGKSG